MTIWEAVQTEEWKQAELNFLSSHSSAVRQTEEPYKPELRDLSYLMQVRSRQVGLVDNSISYF